MNEQELYTLMTSISEVEEQRLLKMERAELAADRREAKRARTQNRRAIRHIQDWTRSYEPNYSDEC